MSKLASRPALWPRVMVGILAVVLSVSSSPLLLSSSSTTTSSPPPLFQMDLAKLVQHDVIPSDRSVYVPGAGFSGFWYHLGFFRALTDFEQYDYYCYSSGCLSVVLGFLETPIDETYRVCREIQNDWNERRISSYDLIDEFSRRLVPRDADALATLLPRINIISTSLSTGVEILRPSNRSELVSSLKRTTWIPFLTGRGWLQDASSRERYLDGYFSVPLHPPCRYTARVPFSWSAYFHSLNPGVSKTKVFEFVAQGVAHGRPFSLDSGRNTTI